METEERREEEVQLLDDACASLLTRIKHNTPSSLEYAQAYVLLLAARHDIKSGKTIL